MPIRIAFPLALFLLALLLGAGHGEETSQGPARSAKQPPQDSNNQAADDKDRSLDFELAELSE